MATMAVSSDGLAYSRVFIADEADLDISVMPDILDKQVSYIRVMRWNWPSKKGWCQTNSNEMIPYAKMTESTWLYNWDAVSTRTADLDYAPIRQKLGWPSFSTIRSQDDVSHLLSFNEPDHVEQSDVTVDQAIADWPEHLKTGLRLGSPATTDYGWLYNFIDKCDSAQYRVDYIVVHCYWENRTPQQWYNSLKYVHERCGGRGIWIKEWNNGANWTNEWWPSDANEQFAKQKSDLKGILAVLDTAHFIERYSIYNWVEDKRAMILGGSLTPAGELYRDNKPDFAFSRVNEVIPSWTAKAVELNDPEVISGTGVKDRKSVV